MALLGIVGIIGIMQTYSQPGTFAANFETAAQAVRLGRRRRMLQPEHLPGGQRYRAKGCGGIHGQALPVPIGQHQTTSTSAPSAKLDAVAYKIQNALTFGEVAHVRGSQAQPRLRIEPLDVGFGLRKQACDSIKRAITEMDIYGQPDEIRLDERQLGEDLGVSRTPIREALSILEQEGFVRTIPRRGIFVVRKSKREIVEMITVWAAIESMAARIAATSATQAEIDALTRLMDAFEEDPAGHLTEYSDANMAFHKAIIRLGGIDLMSSLTDSIFIHMRAVRAVTMTQDNRAQRSVADHRAIIAGLRAADPDLAERLVRDHTLGLAAHVERHGDFLDSPGATTERRAVAAIVLGGQ
jgi:DNA-binding GntR family transcriptional regulator